MTAARLFQAYGWAQENVRSPFEQILSSKTHLIRETIISNHVKVFQEDIFVI